MIAAVLDANVLAPAVRGFANPDNTLGELLRRWRDGRFQLVVSQPILDELSRTLANSYFSQSLTDEQRARAVRLLARRARFTPITVEVRSVASHPEDDLILATAVSARADYLVTGDRQLLKLQSYLGVTIVSPRDFLALLEHRGVHER